jgi:hypothetical protein
MAKNIITDKNALKRLIEKSVNETLYGLIPEEATAPAPTAAVAPTSPTAAPVQGQNNVSVSKVAAGTPGQTDPGIGDLQKGQVTLEMVVEKLNSLRSGRSFKDENIAAQMQQYFNDLNDNEKLALYAFAKGIAQIVTGEVMGAQAADPGQTNPKIEMKDQGNMQQVKHVRPNIIKKAPAGPTSPTAGAENTSAPTPIVAKQR